MGSKKKPMKVKLQDNMFNGQDPAQFSQVWGSFKNLDAEPSHVPQGKLDDQIAIYNGTVYVYDRENNQWIGSSSVGADSVFIGCSDQNLTDTTTEVIQFNNDSTSAFNDTNNNFNTTTYTYTVPATGLYDVSMYLEVEGQGYDYTPSFYVGGSQKEAFSFYCSTPSRNQTESRSFRAILSLTKDDALTARCYSDNLGSGTAKIRNGSSLSIVRLT